MSAGLPPLLLRPHYVAKPWGGRRLAEDLGRRDLPAGPVGESWEVFDLGAAADDPACSTVAGGPFDGRPLREVLGRPFPLLLKVIDAREALSVQVHPDGRDPAPAKEEAWVALADGGEVAVAPAGASWPVPAPAGAWLERLERTALVSAAADGTRAPTCVHVPPGTVHAILGGALLLEVQNPVDRTWRLDDHGRRDAQGRPRALHLDEAAGVLARPAPQARTPEARRLAGERFALELLPPGVASAPTAICAFFLAAGRVEHGAAEPFEVPAGRTVVLPEAVRALRSDGWMIAASAL